jgi:iron complex outermembrane receptor protein
MSIRSTSHVLALRPVAAAACLALLAQGAALAQPAPAAPATTTAEPAVELESVVVTATRREEPLQKVPVAVSVVDGRQLEAANRNNASSIVEQIPSLNYRTNSSNKDASLFVRGVGTISTSPGVEPSVSTVVDGVVFARPGQATLDLLDIERVEVLRGPQGTLFGKNASAGVLNVTSRTPTDQTRGFLDASFLGDGNERRLRGGISGALNDRVRGSLTALFSDYDGNVKNVDTGKTVNGYDNQGLRGKLVIDPGSNFLLTLAADYVKTKGTVPSGVPALTTLRAYPSGAVTDYPATRAVLSPVRPSLDNRRINSDFDSYVKDTNWGLSATAEWWLGDYTLTSITALRRWENDQFQDGSRLPVIYTAQPRSRDVGNLDFSQFSQELRVDSPKGGFLEYVGGLYFIQTKNDEIYRRDLTSCSASTSAALLPGLVPCLPGSATFASNYGRAVYGTRSKSASVFGESTLNFTPTLRGIAGLRVTRDELEYTHERFSTAATALPGINPAVGNAGDTSKTGVSGRLGLQHDLGKDATSYLTYSRGYKGPAYNVFFNMQDRDTPALKPETSNAFELGLKSTSFDKRLQLNLALFHTKYDNYQANYFDTVAGTVVTRLINAGSVVTRGLELDFSAKPLPQWTLSGGAARISARIDEFNCPAGAAASCQVNGKPLPFSPDWKLYVGSDYRILLNNGLVLNLSADYRWQSKVHFDIAQAPDAVQGAYGIVNAGIALSNPAKGWRVALVAKNLADKSYSTLLTASAPAALRWVPRDDGRYFGVNFRQDF